MATQTASGLLQEVGTYYDKKFLQRAEYEYIFEQGAQMRNLPANSGKTVQFTRYTSLATATTPLTEGVNPSEVSLTAVNVTATPAEYGNTVKISRFLTLVGIDADNAEKIEVIGQNMGETLDELVRNELFTGASTVFAGGKGALSSIAASDTMSVKEIQKVVKTLKKNKARRYSNNVAPWLGKLTNDTAYDLQRDSDFINADVYDNGATKMYRGELGKIAGTRLLESANGKTESSSVTVHSNFFHGSDAFGTINLSEDKPKLYIIPHTKIDSGNPAGRFSIVSWAGTTVTKTLNQSWLINLKTAATS